jgi:hypothetical protein
MQKCSCVLSYNLRATADEQNKIQLRFRSSVEAPRPLTAPTRKAGFTASCDFYFVNKFIIFVLKFCSNLSALRVAAKRYKQSLIYVPN